MQSAESEAGRPFGQPAKQSGHCTIQERYVVLLFTPSGMIANADRFKCLVEELPKECLEVGKQRRLLLRKIREIKSKVLKVQENQRFYTQALTRLVSYGIFGDSVCLSSFVVPYTAGKMRKRDRVVSRAVGQMLRNLLQYLEALCPSQKLQRVTTASKINAHAAPIFTCFAFPRFSNVFSYFHHRFSCAVDVSGNDRLP